MKSGKFTGGEIVRDMEKMILDKKLATGFRLGTSREWGERYAVSPRTVERAMARLVKRGLIRRIPGKGTFVLSSQPMLKKPRVCFLTYRQAKYLDDPADARFAAFHYLEELIRRELIAAGYNPEHIFENSSMRPEERDALLKTNLDKYDIVITPAGEQDFADAILRSCRAQKILIFDDEVRHGPWHQIVYDYRPGFARALQFFRKTGVRKIISVGITDAETSRRRMDVFREQAVRLGYAEEDITDRFEPLSHLSGFISGKNFAEYYLAHELFDQAIFSTSDFLAIGMMMEFKRRGATPGKDFQLISYDNFEKRLKHPDFQFGITGITHPQDAMVKALLAMLENLERGPSENQFYQTYFVPAWEFVIRDSTKKNNR